MQYVLLCTTNVFILYNKIVVLTTYFSSLIIYNTNLITLISKLYLIALISKKCDEHYDFTR